MSRGRGEEDGEGLCDVSGNGVREERESTEVSCSRAGDETGRGVEDLSSSSSLVFCCAQHQNCVVLKLIFDL